MFNVNGLTFSDKRVSDLVTCAMEGGIGYWARIVKFDVPAVVVSATGDDQIYKRIDYPFCEGGAVYITDRDDDTAEICKLDRAALQRGLEVLAKDCKPQWENFIGDNEDADTGDLFIQYCLFGELVYG